MRTHSPRRSTPKSAAIGGVRLESFDEEVLEAHASLSLRTPVTHARCWRVVSGRTRTSRTSAVAATLTWLEAVSHTTRTERTQIAVMFE